MDTSKMDYAPRIHQAKKRLAGIEKQADKVRAKIAALEASQKAGGFDGKPKPQEPAEKTPEKPAEKKAPKKKAKKASKSKKKGRAK